MRIVIAGIIVAVIFILIGIILLPKAIWNFRFNKWLTTVDDCSEIIFDYLTDNDY